MSAPQELTPSSPAVLDYIEGYTEYLDASPTSYHAVDQAAQMLDAADFVEVDLAEPWPTTEGKFFVARDGAIVAWVQFPDAVGFALAAGHTDSPALKLKPLAQRTTPDGWGQLMVEVYGGALHNSWLDRELLLAGAVADWGGTRRLIRTGPIAFIPQLAPHMDREVNTRGLILDPQEHLQPLWLVDDDRQIMDLVAAEAGLAGPEEIAASQLFLIPSQPAQTFGVDNQFLMSGNQDNLSSAYAGLSALTSLAEEVGESRWPSDRIPVLGLFDHEEIGSGSPTGARGPLLEEVMERINVAFGGGEERRWQLQAGSTLLSVDAAHSVNPAYPDQHGPMMRPVMGRGPTLKLDAGQRYSTSLEGIQAWRRAVRDSGIPSQEFVSHSSKRAGSTVGPALATRLGIDTVDVGIPLLAMHSTRETAHVLDPVYLSLAMAAYWTA